MKDLKEKYTVKKSIRFELKSIHNKSDLHKDDIDFQTTSKWMEQKFFTDTSSNPEKTNEYIRKTLKDIFQDFSRLKEQLNCVLDKIENRSVPAFCLHVKAPLLENLDSNLFHEQKRKNRFNQTKFIPLPHLKIDDYDWFLSGMRKKIDNVYNFQVRIENHSGWTENKKEEKHPQSKWYKDIESFCKRYIELIELFQFIRILSVDEIKDYRELDEREKNVLAKIQNLEHFLKDEFVNNLKKNLESIKDSIKNSEFIECGLTSLNDKSLNKNPDKRKKEEDWLKDTIDKREPILKEISLADEQRKILLDGDKNNKGLYQLLREESKIWAKTGQDTCKEYAIHLLDEPQYNQDLYHKKVQIKKLREEQNEKRKNSAYPNRTKNDEIDGKQYEIYRLQIEKKLIQDRKKLFLDKCILSFEIDKKFQGVDVLAKKCVNEKNIDKKAKLLNFQNVWNISKKCDIHISSELKSRLNQNQNLIKRKFKLSREYGDKKNLINSLQREIERQGKIEYQSILIRDRHFYYLALLERGKRKELKNRFFQENQDGECQFLEYERLTFKSLEKLALIENATFTEFDELEDKKLAEEIRKEWNNYKNKNFENYRLNGQEKQECKKRGIHFDEFSKDKQNEIKNNIIKLLTKVIKKLRYEFEPSENYETFNDFVEDINKQCYETKWISFDWEKLLEGEKQGEIKLFKIHNKDFSRDKREHSNKKNNLFTEYWLDLFERNNKNVRILPEIDLYKKPKEKEMSGGVCVKNSQGKELKGTVRGRRLRENKFYAGFKLEFYPEKIMSSVDEFNKELEKSVASEKKYFLGLDRGEKELITYCLVDEQGNVVLNNDKKPIIGDWNKDPYSGFDYKEHHLKNYTITRQQLSDKYYLLAMSDSEDEKKKLKEEIKKLEEEKHKDSIVSAETIKKGFCGHFLREVNKIMQQFENVYVVLEDLDREQDKGHSNKEAQLEKSLGGSVYQVIEDAIVSKFKYYYTKDKDKKFEGSQIVPNIERVQDLRILKESDSSEKNKFGRIKYLKSKEQIGNILFVDEFLTSQTCPECGFCLYKDQEERKRLPEFSKNTAIPESSLNEAQIQKEGENYKVKLKDRELIIKQAIYLKEGLNNCESVKKYLRDLMIPRLKNVDRYKEKKKVKETDPVYCPNCGKNSDEGFTQPVKSGDEVAAYNIAIRGRDYVKNQNPKNR